MAQLYSIYTFQIESSLTETYKSKIELKSVPFENLGFNM